MIRASIRSAGGSAATFRPKKFAMSEKYVLLAIPAGVAIALLGFIVGLTRARQKARAYLPRPQSNEGPVRTPRVGDSTACGPEADHCDPAP